MQSVARRVGHAAVVGDQPGSRRQFPGLQAAQVRMDCRSVGDEAVGPAMDLAGAAEFKKIWRKVFLQEGGIVAGSFMPQGMFQREEFRFAHGVVHG